MTEDDLDERARLVTSVVEQSREPLDVPLGLTFRPVDGESDLRAWSEQAARGERIARATLYVHVPFCARVCSYCLLSAVRTPGKDGVARYLAALRTQIALYETAARGLRFGSLHIGGGTPTLLDEHQLDALLSDLARLPLTEQAQIGVEAHPGTSTPGRLAVLRRHGVHRVSLGVESLTPEVLRNVNREDQNETRVRAAVAEARRLGLQINLDLLAGLPGETTASWEETVRKTLALEPDSMSVNRFLGESSALAAFGFGPSDEENTRVDAMLLRADGLVRELAPPRWPAESLVVAGFGTQYVWDRSTDARPYFQDDMMGPASTLALGHGALGHLVGRHFSVAAGAIDGYVASLAQGRPPPMMACALDNRFEKACFLSDQACRGHLSGRAYQTIFGEPPGTVFRRELRFLLEHGLLRAEGNRLWKPPNRSFHVVHLLAFLLRDVAALRDARTKLAVEPRDDRRRDDLAIDVGRGLDADAATKLYAAHGGREGRTIEIRDDGRRVLRQYESVAAELTPSMLWVRIAIRAARAARATP